MNTSIMKPGTRILLLKMQDPYPLPSGSAGTITGIDTNGDLLVRWDCGSQLKLLLSIDEWKEAACDDR